MKKYMLGWKACLKRKRQRVRAVRWMKKQKKSRRKTSLLENLLVGVIPIMMFIFAITMTFYQFTN